MRTQTKTAARIAAQMKKRKLKQSELAALMSVNRSRVNDWVHGNRNPRLPTLMKLAKIFDCEVSYLLGVS